MLRRLRLPGKLAVAALPLAVVLVVAAAFLVAAALRQASQDRDTGALAATWEPLTIALAAVDAEAAASVAALQGAQGHPTAAREESDARLDQVEAALIAAGGPDPLLRQLQLARETLGEVRTRYDGADPADRLLDEELTDGYQQVEESLLQVGDLIPAEVADTGFARDLAAVAALGHARAAAVAQEQAVLSRLHDQRAFGATVEIVRAARNDLAQSLAAFEGAARFEWFERYQAEADAFAGIGEMIDLLIESPIDVLTTPDEEWRGLFDARMAALTDLQTSLTSEVVSRATDAAGRARTEAAAIAGAAVVAVLVAGLSTLFVSRSIVRRVRTLTDRARRVADDQLPALVEALRDPSEDVELPNIPPLRDAGTDEVGDLANSFTAMQVTLHDVAAQQLEVLRKGVADMFVTLARRNRGLIDRQLALIDQLEADEDDPELLSDLYRLDHLATRMRRNAESLLVLAGSDSPRTFRRRLEIDDVVRAAIGEVEDYRRIDVLTLEPLEVSGSAVSDLSHLLSELLENSTAFSPPDSRVRVAGHFQDDGYLIAITDRGVGLSPERLAELNGLLESPPIVGLALEPTLGLYVVAMLAKRHGIRVRLAVGAPGLTARVVIPPALFEVPTHPQLSDLGGFNGRAEPWLERSHNGPRPALERRTTRPEPAPPPAPPPPSAPPLLPPAMPSVPPAPGPDALPTRVPGASYREVVEEAPAVGGQAPEDLRDRLGAYEDGRKRAAEHVAAPESTELPTRRPGESLGEDLTREEHSEVVHHPEQVRMALSSYQIGVQVGRRSTRPDDDQGDGGDE